MKLRAIIALAVAVVAAVFVTPAAQAQAYPPKSCPGMLSVSTTHPLPGETITVTGAGFTPGARVHLVMHSKTYDLGTFKANAHGNFSAQVTLPNGVFGHHFIIAASGAPHIRQCQGDPIQIQSPSHTTPPGGHHGTSFTGTDILLIVLIAAGLLAAGFALTRGGKRRQSSDAI